jgi:hypothetical protein
MPLVGGPGGMRDAETNRRARPAATRLDSIPRSKRTAEIICHRTRPEPTLVGVVICSRDAGRVGVPSRRAHPSCRCCRGRHAVQADPDRPQAGSRSGRVMRPPLRLGEAITGQTLEAAGPCEPAAAGMTITIKAPSAESISLASGVQLAPPGSAMTGPTAYEWLLDRLDHDWTRERRPLGHGAWASVGW